MKTFNRSMGCGLIVGSMFASSAWAYQFEAGGTYFDFDDLNDSALAINGIFHFSPVDTAGLPLAEAAFLRRSSNVAAFYSTTDKSDVDVLGLGGEAYLQDFYMSADILRTDTGTTDSDTVSVELGFLPVDGMRFSVGYADDDASKTSAISLNAKIVKKLAGQSAFNFEASVAQSDDLADTVNYEVEGDYYINQALSFGLSYADSDQSNSNEDVGIRARMFFIPMLSAQIQYNMQDFNDRIIVGVAGRF